MQAEELIKTEMLTMLRNDLIHHPTGQILKANLIKIKADFVAGSFESLTEEEMLQVYSIIINIPYRNVACMLLFCCTFAAQILHECY